MAAIEINASGFAATFKLKELVECFAPLGPVQVEKDRLVSVVGPAAWAFAYDFGAVVFVGVPAPQREELLKRLASRLRGEPHAPLDETFLVETGAARPEVGFDRLLVPALTLATAGIAAELLAQSVAMDYYAGDVLEIEERLDEVNAELMQRGRAPRRTRKLIQFIGQCIATRNDVISTLALFDKPEATWESEELDRLWSELHKVFELDDRYRGLEAKLRIFQDNIEVLVDLTRQSQTLRLEVLVAVLIVLELGVMIFQIVAPH